MSGGKYGFGWSVRDVQEDAAAKAAKEAAKTSNQAADYKPKHLAR